MEPGLDSLAALANFKNPKRTTFSLSLQRVSGFASHLNLDYTLFYFIFLNLHVALNKQGLLHPSSCGIRTNNPFFPAKGGV